ncbi:SDR family NAD(P)-dependent oxidoreductase [Actinoplanes sp. KI2]|uniref:SDR family NAD(P)-dependent oxidoreductase n=1 Tax=Actinoplanes sp. KI2 TaxID=2983315 RepID=UPI0021D5EE42|nr:SDR family NAD(P)-dependent oxidoreductase [Actinoplanes sp. KI2]MCU7726555.1 SDR family NAD(P)-dependent oxidoreductase [Actinoplanes sp. KI2]
MTKSIAVIGAGPGLGQAVARRYAREGYAVALVARRPEPLDRLAAQLTAEGARAYPIAADLTDVGAIPALAERIRATAGDPEVLYYGAAADGFVPVLELTSERVDELMTLGVHALLALVREFLPAMLARGEGAILSAQGASALRGNPAIAGGLALAAQRNLLQAWHAEVADRGVYVGGLYIGAAIENTPFHAWLTAAEAAGEPVPAIPSVDPADLAELLWTMQHKAREPEVVHPAA